MALTQIIRNQLVRQRTPIRKDFNMRYTANANDQVDGMVDNIKDSTNLLAKVLFAGFNIVFLVVIGVILVSTLTLH